jgi:hypothetical protein
VSLRGDSVEKDEKEQNFHRVERRPPFLRKQIELSTINASQIVDINVKV